MLIPSTQEWLLSEDMAVIFTLIWPMWIACVYSIIIPYPIHMQILCLNKNSKPKDCSKRNSSSSASNHHSNYNSEIPSYHSWVLPELIRMGFVGTNVGEPCCDTQVQNQYLKTLSMEGAYSQKAFKRMFQKLERIDCNSLWTWETLGRDEHARWERGSFGEGVANHKQDKPLQILPSVFVCTLSISFLS